MIHILLRFKARALWLGILLQLLCGSLIAQNIAYQVWGVNVGGNVYRKNGITANDGMGAVNDWSHITNIPGGAENGKHITVGDDGSVWLLTKNGQLFRLNLDGSWQQKTNLPPEGIKQMDAGFYELVAVTPDDKIYYLQDLSASSPLGGTWKELDGRLKHVSISATGKIWGVNSGDNIYYRGGTGSNYAWKQIGGKLKQICVGTDDYPWGVNSGTRMYDRTGIPASDPTGGNWHDVSGTAYNGVNFFSTYVAKGTGHQVWGLHNEGSNPRIFFFQQGTGWREAGGGLVQLDVGVSEPRDGDVVAIRAVQNGKYFRMRSDGSVYAEGSDPNDAFCQFRVIRDGKNIGFETANKIFDDGLARRMQVNPDNYVVSFANPNFGGWERFEARFLNGSWFLWNTHLSQKQGDANRGYLSVRVDVGNVVRGSDHANIPAIAGGYERLQFVHISRRVTQGEIDLLFAGKTIALRSRANGKFLAVGNDPFVQGLQAANATASDTSDPATRFRLDKYVHSKTKDVFVGLYSLAKNGYLFVPPTSSGQKGHLALNVPSPNFAEDGSSWEQLWLERSGDAYYFRSRPSDQKFRGTGGCINVINTGNGGVRIHSGQQENGEWMAAGVNPNAAFDIVVLGDAPAASAASGSAQKITVNYAWYGVEDGGTKNDETAKTVIAKLNDVINKYGFIAIPADMNKFYGIDPFPGRAKTTAIAVTVNGTRVSPDLRVSEGKDFVFPKEFEGTDAAKKALDEVKSEATISAASGSYVWKDEWSLPIAGSGKITFTATANDNIHIAFSDTKGTKDPMYEIVIGGWGNTKSVIRRKSQGPPVFTSVAKITNPGQPITYTVILDKNTKKIRIEGASQVIEYTDPAFISGVRYFSFSSWNSPITYSKIQSTGPKLNILHAWYGVEDGGAKNDETAKIVIPKLNESINKYGFIVIPADMNKFYGMDPFPGRAKTTAIAVTVNGVKVSPDPRAPEGNDFIYPKEFEGTDAAKKALQEIGAAIKAAPAVSPIPAQAVTPQAELKAEASKVVVTAEEAVGKALDEPGRVVPGGYSIQGTDMKRIAMAERDGEKELWVVGTDGKLYYYDFKSISDDKWEEYEALDKDADGNAIKLPIKDVTLNKDGEMYLIADDNAVYRYNWEEEEGEEDEEEAEEKVTSAVTAKEAEEEKEAATSVAAAAGATEEEEADEEDEDEEGEESEEKEAPKATEAGKETAAAVAEGEEDEEDEKAPAQKAAKKAARKKAKVKKAALKKAKRKRAKQMSRSTIRGKSDAMRQKKQSK